MTQHEQEMKPNITVIGVGGAGGNAVNNMIASQLEGVDFVVANTDAQALEHSSCKSRIQLGHKLTAGLGAGSKAEIGAEAAEESEAEIKAAIQDANMVFITAGMGGGTGTGAAPVIARISRELGILTIGVVTKPFQFEGVHRMRSAEKGLEEMARHVDTLIIIPNQNLFRICDEKTTFKDAFKLADAVLNSGVRNVTDLVVMNGLINLDFADIRSVMAGMGKAMMGMGEGEGEGRAVQAAEAAISNPLLDDITMRGARGVLINITGGPDMTLFEVDEAANRIREEVDAEANIIFGSTFDDAMEGKLRVSVVATGFDSATIKPELQVAPAAEFDQAMIVEPNTAESVSSAGDFGEFSGGSLNGEPADDQALNGHGIDGDQDSDDSWDAWAPEKPSINPQPLPLRGASDDKPYKNGDARRESASEFGSFVDGNTLRKLDPFGDDDWGKNHANGAAFFENKPEKPRHTVTPMPPVSGGESRQKVVDEALVEDVTAWITRKYLGPKKAVSDKPVNGSANGSAAVLSQLNGHAAVAGDLASTSEDSQTAMDSGAEMTAGIAQPESEKDPEIAAQSDLARDDDLGHEDNAVANGAPDSDPVPSFLQEGATIPVEASASIPATDEPSRSETDDDDEDQNSGGSSGAPETAKPAKGGAIRNLLRSLNPISGGTTNRRSIDTGRKVLDRLNRLHGYPDSEEGASHA